MHKVSTLQTFNISCSSRTDVRKLRESPGQSFPRLKATGCFTDFLDETVFWNLSFLIRNYNKRAVFEKMFNQYFVFFWKHFIVASCLSSVALVVNKACVKGFFSRKANLSSFLMKKRNFSTDHFSQKVPKTDHSPSA